MPDKTRQALAAYFASKYEGMKCEVCGCGHWNINEAVVTPLILAMGGNKAFSLRLDAAHPSVAIHCNDCGNTKTFSLTRLGFDVWADHG